MQSQGATDQWGSPWAWFGATAGSTCWLAISTVVLAVHGEIVVAAAFALCFFVPLAVSLRAWERRNNTPVHAAFEAWFVVAWLASLAAIAVVHLTDTHALINLEGDSIWLMWLGLLIGGALLGLAIRRRRHHGDDGAAGALFDVFASWF